MTHSSLLGAELIVVGMAVGGFIVEQARGQGHGGPIVNAGWPPRPQDIVNLRNEKGGVEDGDLVRVFEVPADKWLVLTDVRFDGWGDFDFSVGLGVNVTWSMLQFGEDSSGRFTPRIGVSPASNWYGYGNLADHSFDESPSMWGNITAVPYSSPVGLVFRPGSVVKIRYMNASDTKGDAYFANVNWNLTGYLSDV